MNKKGWLRITEAIFGIMLMFAVLLVVYEDNSVRYSDGQRIVEMQRVILEKVASNYTLRNATLNGNESSLSDFVRANLDDSLGFDLLICNLSVSCVPNQLPKVSEIYSEERIIGANVDKYEPKRLKLFVWKGEKDFSSEALLEDGTV